MIDGNQSIPVTLKFTNKGGASGSVTAKLIITSNSPGNESLTVPMSVVRTGSRNEVEPGKSGRIPRSGMERRANGSPR